MKKGILFIALIFSIISISLAANPEVKKISFKVSGNCGMCEKTIETAAKSIDGVLSGNWNKTSKTMDLRFDTNKTSVKTIHKAIAKSGYDTDKLKADDSVYNKLHSCCKYRK